MMRPWSFVVLLLMATTLVCGAEVSRVVETRGIPVRLSGVSDPLLESVRELVTQQVGMTRDTAASPPLADDLAFFVGSLYQELGYPTSGVQWSIEGREVVLEVTEGEAATVGDITFVGNRDLDTKELTDHLLRPTKELRTGVGNAVPFIELKLLEGATIVQRYCQSLGYLDAVVPEPVFVAREGGLVWDVSVGIELGQQYHFGDLTLSGDLARKDDDVQELLLGLRGLPFNEVKVESIRNEIAKFFQEYGYFHVKVIAHYSLAGGRDGVVPVVFHVEKGQRFRVTGINIAPGFSAGAQRLIRGSFSEAMGDLYVPGEVEIMHRRTMDTEVFARLDLDPVTAEDGTMVLNLSGSEALRARAAAYAGYETFDGPIIGGELRRVNLFDTGYAMQFEAELNGRGWKSTLKGINPAFLDTPTTFDIAVSAYTEEFFDIVDKAYGVQSNLRRQLGRHVTVTGFAEVSAHEINSEAFEDLFELLIGPLEYKIAMAGTELSLDFRDSPVLPKKGWLMSLGVKGGTGFAGSDVEFLQADTSFAGYVPLTKKLRTAFRARSSVIYNTGGVQNLPLDLRLFNGGATTVRSFPEQELGLTLLTIGGVQTNTFNLELSYEVIPNLELALFGDAGSLQQEAENPFASAHEDLRYAVGLGVRYKLPFGPLRVDYGVNVDRQEGEDFGALHITFGFAF